MRALKNKTSEELFANITNIETQKKLENRVLIREFLWEGKYTNRNETSYEQMCEKNEIFNMWKGCCTTRKVNMWYDDSI